MAKTVYTAHATVTGGRDQGHGATSDGNLDVQLRLPKDMGGEGDGTNPEQLFAVGYAACFGSAVGHVARAKKLTTGPVSVTAKVAIGPVGQRFGLAVELEVAIPELARPEAEALVAAAHEVCPYSNATRGNIAVEVKLAGA